MNDIAVLVDLLENKILSVQQKMHKLSADKQELDRQIENLMQQQIQLRSECTQWKAKYESLKVANAILGSNENKTEVKFKINALIREIDACIIQLSE